MSAPDAATLPLRREAGPRYSESVSWSGPTVYLSGQVPETSGAGSGAAAQTREVLALIDARLAAAGSDKAHLLSATIYMVDLKRDYAEMNEAWDAWVPQGAAPARTTVGVAALAREEWALEITVVAAVRR